MDTISSPRSGSEGDSSAIAAAIDGSDVPRALLAYDAAIMGGSGPWEIHDLIFEPVQRVLNPPFINPHLPKMYGICRELAPRLEKEDLPSLVRLEVAEYARRPKLGQVESPMARKDVAFADIERSLSESDPVETATLMASFWRNAGAEEFARRLLLLGSGYLEKSLGHSISCTAFILLEGMQRGDQELWPMFVLLADYFHKGHFDSTPPLDPRPLSDDEMHHHLLRAASGGGIIELHDTITIYAIERVRRLFSSDEYNHLLRSWIGYLKDKEALKVDVGIGEAPESYESFFAGFSSFDTDAVVAAAASLAETEEGKKRLARYLVRAVCDLYQGNYNPHHITGLGSLFWLLDRQPPRQVMLNGVHQYVSYFFSEYGKSRG